VLMPEEYELHRFHNWVRARHDELPAGYRPLYAASHCGEKS
jgi:hypothetical protein